MMFLFRLLNSLLQTTAAGPYIRVVARQGPDAKL